jgi:hypothetical protein
MTCDLNMLTIQSKPSDCVFDSMDLDKHNPLTHETYIVTLIKYGMSYNVFVHYIKYKVYNIYLRNFTI